jgi:beta-glucosidase
MTDADAELPAFGPDFIWGAATAAYQVEGAVNEDGRGRTVWDTFSHQPGAIADGSTGDVACDHYHRYAEDVELMARLGLTGYRFSVAWSRIQPDGSGPVNQEGIAFYDRLIDTLLARGIAPAATLFHWDLPQALQDQGGWLSREVTDRFADYADLVGRRFADRIAYWMPVNEPNVVTFLGHAFGQHAPGSTLGMAALPVAHHLLLGHGKAVQALRAAGASQVGSANNHSPIWPASAAAEDVAAADTYDDAWNRIFADSMLLGRYPDRYADQLPVQAGDLAVISEPLDFYGMNYYNPLRIGAAAGARDADAALYRPLGVARLPIEGYPITDFGWPVVPDGLREVLNQLKQRYAQKLPPVLVTENGCSYDDAPDSAGAVHDERRIRYLEAHLRAVRQAINDGVQVNGYFCWSIMDNFEWAEGFRQRFGLVQVDYETLRRTPKDSYHWYAAQIRAARS